MQTPKDLQEFQRFVADLSKHAQDSMKAGKSVDEATASFSVDKYPGYKNERVKAAVAAIPKTTQNSEPTATPLPIPRATKSTRKIMCGTQPMPFRAYMT